MSESAAINVRLTELFVELSQARRALETCPANERLSIANRIKVVMDEIDRGQALTRASSAEVSRPAASNRIVRTGEPDSRSGAHLPPSTSGDSHLPVASNPDGQGAAFLPYVQKVTT